MEDKLLAIESLTKRGGAMIIRNTGKIIASITLIIALLLTFTDIKLGGFGSEEFTTTLAVMLIASYLMYFSLEDAGERLGEESDEYRTASDRLSGMRDRISGADTKRLREWCDEYTKADVEHRIRRYVESMGYSYEEYLLGIGRRSADPRQRRVFRRASKMHTYPLTVQMLLSSGGTRAESELCDKGRYKSLRMALRLLPTALISCLTVSVMLTMKDGLGAAEIIESLFKLSSLPIIGFRGYAAGFHHVREYEIPRKNTLTRILESFVDECKQTQAVKDVTA